MAASVLEDIKKSRDLDQQLSIQLAKGDESLSRIAETLEAIRSTSESAITSDFNLAAEHHAEDRIWKAHQSVNAYFRTALVQAQKQSIQFVATRKIRAEYVKFIKSSQRFYRNFILCLSKAYGGITTLERVAKTLNRDVPRSRTPFRSAVFVTEIAILRSCHRTIIQLGDLSRYREMEVGGEKRDWSAAIGFYDLAGSILPSSGQSQHQLAVLALADGNLFRAVYHLYRSLSTEEPHPLSEKNLTIAFNKISSGIEKGALPRNNNASKGKASFDALVGWHLRLITLCYQGRNLVETELEDEVSARFTLLLKEDESGPILHRLILVNIASTDAAQRRFQAAAENNSYAELYSTLLRLNLRFFVAMLELLRNDLSDLLMRGYPGQKVEADALAMQLSSSTAVVLPHLRIYNAWLRKNVSFIATLTDEASVRVHQQFWYTYSQCLTVMAEVFPADALPDLPYLLEEDVDTIGFQPLHCDATRSIWYNDGKLRTPWHASSGTSRPTSAEVLFRIRGILVTGLELAFDSYSPLAFDQDQYCFRAKMEVEQDNHSDSKKERDIELPEPTAILSTGDHPKRMTSTVSTPLPISLLKHDSQDLEVDAQRMVDSLVNTTSEVLDANLTADSILGNGLRSLLQHEGTSDSPMNQVRSHKSSHQNSRKHSPMSRQLDSWAPNSPADLTTYQMRGFPSQHGPITPKQPIHSNRFASTSRSSPLPPPGIFEHNRHQSADSTRSRNSIWSPEDAWNVQTGYETPLGISVKGNIGNGSFEAAPRYEQSSEYAMGSSLLFGAGTSPWNVSALESRRMSESPRMASLWDTPSAPRGALGRPLS